MEQTDTIRRSLRERISLRIGRSVKCSVCERPFRRTTTWDDHMASPLYQYIVLHTCPTCRSHRAVYSAQAAAFMGHFHGAPPGAVSADGWQWLEQAVNIDGNRDPGYTCSAVHVYEAGTYVPIREWIDSPLHLAAHEAHQRWLSEREAAKAAT